MKMGSYRSRPTASAMNFPLLPLGKGPTGSEGNYSVRYISKDSNQAGGRWIGAWYAYDRILGRDLFNVKVNP
ncbi:hypothetical protein ACFQ4Y_07950 [Kroppenstedtia sanguinis]|uniref:Uncharacterized protein n=1 Tax=Kroppenstedtia sanguinis TaxID=1380684 RepID=A0ABW4C809_9BACL